MHGTGCTVHSGTGFHLYRISCGSLQNVRVSCLVGRHCDKRHKVPFQTQHRLIQRPSQRLANRKPSNCSASECWCQVSFRRLIRWNLNKRLARRSSSSSFCKLKCNQPLQSHSWRTRDTRTSCQLLHHLRLLRQRPTGSQTYGA